ncbi:phosphoserine phosphatase [Arthrobacter nitrophenolicus]|uniref:phosphoserine phosphatase n=1 Tax=Arthrobacter nitrophenolicus TaxID=683150 RepID=L8TQX7_9MICC|nr:phosphoserine phosphatase [Arthrobacter nitrophenolicus]
MLREDSLGDERYRVQVAELALPDATAAGLAALRRAVAEAGIDGQDTALVPGSLRSAPRKLLIMDVDSTLIQQEVIELLAAYAGKFEEVAAVTEAAMRGELDFTQSLHARVAVLAGLPADVVHSVRQEVKLSEGAAELVAAFKAAGHVVAVVSGGFNQILQPIAEELGLDYWQANELEIVDGVLTGKVLGAVVDRAAKEKYLREWAAAEGIALEHTVAVGDGANDLDMLGAAGIGVAFNAKPAVRAVADAAVNMPYLDAVRYVAGV